MVAGLRWVLDRSDYSFEPEHRDALFQLRREMHVVWSLELPRDHELGEKRKLWYELLANPPILGTLPGRFELRAVTAAQRILFQVESIDGAWSVRQLSRIPY